MNKTRILGWLVVLLLLLNLTTLGTIIYHNNSHKSDTENITIDPANKVILNGRFFKQTLGFDADQMHVFRSSNQVFQPLALEMLTKINDLKQLTFNELNRNNPDTLLLNQYSEETGVMHAELKKATHRFYLKLQEICNEEQRLQLRDAFTPLFQSDDCSEEFPKGQGRGRQYNRYQPKDTLNEN